MLVFHFHNDPIRVIKFTSPIIFLVHTRRYLFKIFRFSNDDKKKKNNGASHIIILCAEFWWNFFRFLGIDFCFFFFEKFLF